MPQPNTKTKYRPLPAALLTLVVLLASTLLIWLAVVRPQLGKGRTETLCDNFDRSELLADGDTAAQVFTYDKALYTIGLEFYLPGAQPQGELEVVLSDADTGEELARSTGVMQNIIPDQYTTLGLDPVVPAQEGRRYRLSITAHYTSDAILAIGHSNGVALWKEQMTLNGEPVDGTLAMQVTYQRMGGYLTRFFLLAGGAAALLAAFAVYACLSRKVSLHRLVFVLVLGFGLIYSVTLPPYAAPVSAGRPTPTSFCRTKIPPSSPGRSSPTRCSPPPTPPTPVIRNTTSCRLTRTRCCIWPAAVRCSLRIFCTWALPRRWRWGGWQTLSCLR